MKRRITIEYDDETGEGAIIHEDGRQDLKNMRVTIDRPVYTGFPENGYATFVAGNFVRWVIDGDQVGYQVGNGSVSEISADDMSDHPRPSIRPASSPPRT